MTEQPTTIYGEKRWTNFVVEMVTGPSVTIRALGMAIDGAHVVFFNHWPNGGVPRSGTRIERERVLQVSSDVRARTARE